MSYWSKFWIYILAVTAVLIGGHRWGVGTFSVVPWPLLVALLLSYLPLRSWKLLLIISMAAELLSSLPAGMMTVIMFAPFIMSFWPHRPLPGISLGFFLWISLCCALQFVLLAEYTFFWQGRDVPSVLPLMWIATTMAAYILIVFWYENIEPARRPRTQPRFKSI